MSEEMALFTKTEETDGVLPEDMYESETEKYLIFLSNDIFYGVNADYVVDIITEVNITWLPMLPPHIRGVVNLRGQIVPIIDFRRLLGQPLKDNDCIVVLDFEETKIGILVDTVDQMVDVEKGTILSVPYQNTQDMQKIISGMYSLPEGGGTLMVLDCALLLHGR